MMLSLRKRFDDYETMGEVFSAFKNEFLEITLVEKMWQIMESFYQEILAVMGLTAKYFLINWPIMKLALKNWCKPNLNV